jgi:asparagine synthase (glutamine-hydrolysing)
MFAFGIVDNRKKRVFLARDHLGIKPLVYYKGSNCFGFASEIQSLLKIKNIKLNLNLRALDQYLWLQYIPAPLSIFSEIFKLPPAHRMSIDFKGKISGPEEYWNFSFNPNYKKTEKEWLEETEEVIKDSVKAHLVSDVPFGAFLSGGVDSSTVVAYMSQILDKPVKTFSIGFKEEEFNELGYAKIAAKRWDTEHHTEIVKPDAIGLLPKIVKNYGEPFGDSSAIPTYYVSRLARKYVPMVLSGDGGDEMFTGYDSYRAWVKYLAEKEDTDRQKKLTSWLAHIVKKIIPINPVGKAGKEYSLGEWLQFINYMPFDLRSGLWREEYKSNSDFPLDFFEKEFKRTKNFSNINKVQFMDLKTYLPFDILTKVDVASMMHGLEVRTPIVDKEVLEFAATIPESLNYIKDENGEWQGKQLLKKTVEKYYSKEFIHRNKKGFAVPVQKWFQKDGALYQEINDRILAKNSVLENYFKPESMKKIVDSGNSGHIWLLLFLEEWLRQNK